MSKITRIFLIVFFLAALILLGRYFLLKSNKPLETYVAEIKDKVGEIKESVVDEEGRGDKGDGKKEDNEGNKEGILLDKVFTEVSFASQAPFGIWDERHEEACEEASVIILHYYLQKKNLTPEIAETEIQKIIDYQIKKYGDYKDSDAERTVEIAKDFYGIKNLEVIYDFKKEDIGKELAKGNPIIIPAAGRELGNPYYTQPGPLYHMLVLTGYSGDQIIANDPGTRRGEGYRYDINVLYNAIHDFTGDKNRIGEGRKAMITVKKNEK